ncbi:MAG: hypothetical protein EOP85_06945 [Verrucomicrobiaceae bacterium]|nr:MAG: hypothetical protein EOP85_06945 [Verrucomicrobiaceae bacterium]
MSANNLNWVCFTCRTVRREPKLSDRVPKCHECGADCSRIGYKVAVPKREAVKEWRDLQSGTLQRQQKAEDSWKLVKVRKIHRLEKEVASLEELPENKDRSVKIRKLREDIERYRKTGD